MGNVTRTSAEIRIAADQPEMTGPRGRKPRKALSRRNIMIYTKMVNQLDYSEEAIFLIMGGDHIPILRNLFRDNPFFEVVPPEAWLDVE